MAWFSAAMAVVGTAMAVKGQMKAADAEEDAGRAAKRSAESQAQLAEFNAAVADLQAKDALVRGDQEAQRFRVRTRALIGEQRVGFAAGNIDVGFGSAVDVQADAAFLGELDALTIRTNAAREAWGHRVEASDLRRRAEITRKEGAFAESAGAARGSANRWGATASVFNTGSMLADKYGFQGPSKPAAGPVTTVPFTLQ